MKKAFLFFLFFSLCCFSSVDAHAQQRKKVAVVLSGGGAKGMAHIGVLKVLERAGIPVDIVTGTSMGSIVGGLYSVGYTAHQLDSMVRVQNWSYILLDKDNLREQNIDSREKDNTYFLGRGVTFKNQKNVASAGLLKGHNLARLFRNLTVGYTDSLDFNRLPRPFACVATDIVTNQEYVFHRGVLAEAMRASMSIPVAFPPVRKGDMILVDGGLQNNYPADIAKEMGADIIIGVSVQGKPRTAETIKSTGGVLLQLIDINCLNKFDENMAITDVPIRVETEPYSAASFTPAAIDSLIRRGEEAAMRNWDALIALKSKIGIADHEPIRPLTRLAPQVVQGNFKVNRLDFENVTSQDASFIRQKFGVREGDSINLQRLEAMATSMRVDLFYDNVMYQYQRAGDGYTITFQAGDRKNLQLHVGARFDTEEMAAVQANAEIPFHTSIPFNLDATLRLGKRIKARLEGVIHPISFSKMRLAYEYSYNDINLYNEGNRSYNTTFNHHQIDFNLLDFNVRNFNITMGASWDYYHYVDVLADMNWYYDVPDGTLDEHFYTYHFETRYNSEDDWYFPTRGSRFHGRFAYYTDNFAKYKGHVGFSSLEAAWRTSFPISHRLTIQPMAYGRLLFGSDVPVIMGNMVGGNHFGHYFMQQMPFAGVGYVEFVDDHFIGFQLRVQERLFKNIFLLGKVNAAQSASSLRAMFDHHTHWGISGCAYYKSFVGPLGIDLGWSNIAKKFGATIYLGYEF